MRKDRKLRMVAIFAILVSIIGLGVGYAALNEALTINSKTSIKAPSWSIHFKPLTDGNTTYVQPTVTGLARDITGVTETITTGTGAKVDATNITLATELSQPGDKAVYEFSVINDGTIDATLTSITGLDDLSDFASKHVSFTVLYDGVEVTSAADLTDKSLDHNAEKTIKITIEFDPDTTAEQLETITSDVTIQKTITFNYVQK